MVYDELKFSLRIEDDAGKEIALSALSSGEKQIVSVFSHLYLDEHEDQIVIIDEPELSLSVPWQKRFLNDILESKRCSMLVAVTHSPFIYDEYLREATVDLRRLTETRKA
jgi:energy-coupling factor transporter ATP-binding protein EcfA2